MNQMQSQNTNTISNIPTNLTTPTQGTPKSNISNTSVHRRGTNKALVKAKGTFTNFHYPGTFKGGSTIGGIRKKRTSQRWGDEIRESEPLCSIPSLRNKGGILDLGGPPFWQWGRIRDSRLGFQGRSHAYYHSSLRWRGGGGTSIFFYFRRLTPAEALKEFGKK